MKKILLIDDDKDLCLSLEAVLKSNGYEVLMAFSGAEGLRTTLSQKPDVIVLDVAMETDTAGFEFLYQIRSTRDSSRYKAVRNTPVILLTAINETTHSRFSLDDKDNFLPEISDLMDKPVHIEVLLSKIKTLI